ncbi:MAG: hypothetical protein M3384_06220 [Acidobacteriota bacterium]|nr:hypothetical protein [Acidobacteriota bacterium]
MTEQTKMLLNFLALIVMGLPFLYRALGIYEMTAPEVFIFIGKTILLTLSFIISCCLFGKLIEIRRKYFN